MVAISALARRLVRRQVDQTLTAYVVITRGSTRTLNATTGMLSSTPGTIIYSGAARIPTISAEGAVNVGEGSLNQRSTVVTIPWDAPVPKRDDLLTVVQDTLADPNLAENTWRVVGVDGGTLLGAYRHVSCTQERGSGRWTAGQ